MYCCTEVYFAFIFYIYCMSGLSHVELKAEIEKLRAAQKSALNTDREKYRRYLQEITSLRVELHQQERNMAEMQRSGTH